jgi:queuosine precursor transporter
LKRGISLRKYALIGFTRKKGAGHIKKKCSVNANIMIPSTGKQFSIPLSELVSSEIIDSLSPQELKQIYKKYYSNSDVKSIYELGVRNEKDWLAYNILSCMLILFSIASLILGIKPVNVFGISVPSAIFIYPLTYIITDILNEFYGLRYAKRSINITFLSNSIFFLLIYLSLFESPVQGWDLSSSYNVIFNNLTSIFIASSLAYVASEHLNAWLIYKLRILTDAKYLFVRVFFSTIVASIIDSIIFISIAFRYMDNPFKIRMITGQLIVKVFYALFGVIPIHGARFLFNKYLLRRVSNEN